MRYEEMTRHKEGEVKMKKSLLGTVVVVLFVFFCVLTVVKLQIDTNVKLAEAELIEEQNRQIQDEIDAMQNTLDQPKDEKYYEDKAREMVNRYLPEEIIFYNDLAK